MTNSAVSSVTGLTGLLRYLTTENKLENITEIEVSLGCLGRQTRLFFEAQRGCLHFGHQKHVLCKVSRRAYWVYLRLEFGVLEAGMASFGGVSDARTEHSGGVYLGKPRRRIPTYD